MTTHQIFVENIKCDGCVSNIKSALQKIKGVVNVDVYKDKELVCVSGVALERQEMTAALSELGYPEKGNNSFFSKAKTYLRCAVGKD